jgi:hypothetical protein
VFRFVFAVLFGVARGDVSSKLGGDVVIFLPFLPVRSVIVAEVVAEIVGRLFLHDVTIARLPRGSEGVRLLRSSKA